MKQLLGISLLTILIMSACSSNKNVTATRQDLKGTWVVTSTSIEGVDNPASLKITAFDDVALSCFNGSEWYFPNSGYGRYTINSANCAGGDRPIIWSQRVQNGVTFFNFKKMDGVKRSQAKNVAEGYSLEVTSADKSGFTAKSPVMLDGKTIYIVYNFARK